MRLLTRSVLGLLVEAVDVRGAVERVDSSVGDLIAVFVFELTERCHALSGAVVACRCGSGLLAGAGSGVFGIHRSYPLGCGVFPMLLLDGVAGLVVRACCAFLAGPSLAR